MLGHEGPRHVAEGDPCVHGIGGEQAACECTFSIVAEKPGGFLEEYRDPFLVCVRSRGTDREHAEQLGAAVEGGNQMTVDFVGGEPLGFVGTEKPIGNEDRPLADGGIRDQVRIDANRDLKAQVLGLLQHQFAQVHSLGRHGGNRRGLVLGGRVCEDVVRSIVRGLL